MYPRPPHHQLIFFFALSASYFNHDLLARHLVTLKPQALKLHPDRHRGGTKEEAEARTKAFMQCTEAWEILGDPKKRRQYDMSAGEGSGAVAARRGKKHDLVMDPVSVEETGILGR